MDERDQAALASRMRRERTTVRRLLEVRGIVGGHHAPNRPVRIRTDDGLVLAGSWLPGPHLDAPVVVLAHGFAASRRKPAYAFLADVLAGHVHVLSIDLRGHGDSPGECTFGDAERHDVTAAVRAVRDAGHRQVVAVGLSMGGTAVLHAVAEGAEVEAVVAISTPAWLGRVDAPGAHQVNVLWTTPWKRLAFRWLAGVRLVPPGRWIPFAHPRDLAAKIQTPLLVVHGDDDTYFPLDDASELAAAAGGPSTLWIEHGFGHAEDGVTPAFAHRLGMAVHHVLEHGRFPE